MEKKHADSWPAGDGEMAGRIRAFDWSATSLGPIEGWPQSLKTIVGLMLDSPSMMSLVWGPEAIHLYNDTFTDLLREHRILALGRSVFQTFARSRDVFEADLAAAMAGKSARLLGQRYPVLRNGHLEDGWFDVDYVPVRDEAGRIAGVLWTLNEKTAQHLAEQALRASEARRRFLIESWAQAEWEADVDGVAIADSPRWRAYTGQTLEEWLRYGWLDAIHPDDRAHAERQWREATATRGSVNAEVRLRAPGGGWRWTNVRAAPVLDQAGRIERWAGANIDIDARKRAEATLRASEEKYRSLFNAVSQGLAINQLVRDGAGRVTDARLLELNPAYEAQTSLERGRATGRLASEIFPSVGPFWLEMAERVVRTGRAERVEGFVADMGRWFAFDMAPFEGTDRFVVLYDNITDRKQAESVLRQSQERQAFLLKLSDALRPLSDATLIQSTTTQLLGTHLDVDRAMYAEVEGEPGAEIGIIHGQYVRSPAGGGSPTKPFPGRFTFGPFGSHTMGARYRGETLVVADIDTAAGFDTSERAAWAAAGVRAAIVTPLVKDGRLRAEFGVHCGAPRAWTDSEVALIQEIGERTWAAVERARAEAASRASEERFRQFADASAAGLWIRTADTLAMEFVSPALATIYGAEAGALMGDVERWASMIVPEDRGAALQHLQEAREGRTTIHEFRIRRPSDGALRWIRNTDFPLYDDGHIPRVGGIAEDVTGAKLASDRQVVLVAELQHRTRNLIAVVKGLASDTMRETGATRAFRDAFSDRLSALSRVQGLLSRSEVEPITIGALLRLELDALGAGAAGRRVTVAGPEVPLRPSTVQTLALALHELATNARKYGALSHDGGHLAVSWRQRTEAGESRLAIEWVESDLEQVPDRPASDGGYGRELIEQALPHALGARTSYALSDSGVRCTIDLAVRPGEGEP